MSYQVINPFIQFVDTINGKPLSGGFVYFGRQDTDPKNQPSNRINVYAVQDNGTEVLLAQPITLNGAGQPQYAGSAKQLKVEMYGSETAYAIQVFAKSGAQKNYSPRVYSLIDIASLASTTSQVSIAGVTAETAAKKLNSFRSILEFIPQNLIAGIRNYTNATDLTTYMQAAHDTGQIIYYPSGLYIFNKLTMSAGGIVGDYKLSILQTNNTTTENIITYTGGDPTGILVNEVGFYFRDFYLRASTGGQKSSGAGIYINSGSLNENYTGYLGGVTIRNIPTCFYATNSSFMTIERNYFAFYKDNGIYVDNAVLVFGDNGDNIIANNTFYTTLGGFSIKYRTGGGRIIGNKINGGIIGIDISPLSNSSIVIVEGNSIENQTINAIRFFTEGDSTATDFTQIVINGNQIGGYNLTGNAIQFNPTAYMPKTVTINDNIILHKATGTNAIDVRNTDQFRICGNIIDCQNVGFGGVFVAANASNGFVAYNDTYRQTTNTTQILSTTTKDLRIINTTVTAYPIPTIAAGGINSLNITSTGARFGDKVDCSISVGLSGLIMSGFVSATDQITFQWYNPTGASITIGTVDIFATVRKP